MERVVSTKAMRGHDSSLEENSDTLTHQTNEQWLPLIICKVSLVVEEGIERLRGSTLPALVPFRIVKFPISVALSATGWVSSSIMVMAFLLKTR
jgi:hypothetical protein